MKEVALEVEAPTRTSQEKDASNYTLSFRPVYIEWKGLENLYDETFALVHTMFCPR